MFSQKVFTWIHDLIEVFSIEFSNDLQRNYNKMQQSMNKYISFFSM